MNDWPKYVSHKVVSAAVIMQIDEPTDETTARVLFVDPLGDGKTEPFVTTEPGMMARCQVGDYAMVYRDGYRSVCPKKEFEDGYGRLENQGDAPTK